MESVDFYKKGCWEVRVSNHYAFICCPAMNYILSFREKRAIYEELKVLELELEMDGLKEIVGYTGINHPGVMKMFAKVGYKPFHLSLEKDVMWFKKELQNV